MIRLTGCQFRNYVISHESEWRPQFWITKPQGRITIKLRHQTSTPNLLRNSRLAGNAGIVHQGPRGGSALYITAVTRIRLLLSLSVSLAETICADPCARPPVTTRLFAVIRQSLSVLESEVMWAGWARWCGFSVTDCWRLRAAQAATSTFSRLAYHRASANNFMCVYVYQ